MNYYADRARCDAERERDAKINEAELEFEAAMKEIDAEEEAEEKSRMEQEERDVFKEGWNACPGLPWNPNVAQIAEHCRFRDAEAERRYPDEPAPAPSALAVQNKAIADEHGIDLSALPELPAPSGDSLEDATLPLMPTSKRTVTIGDGGLREAINRRANEFYGSGASAFSIDSRELAAKQCIADILEIANKDAALRGAREKGEQNDKQ